MSPDEKLKMLYDEVAVLTAIIEAEGHTTTGSMGQTVIHPAVKTRHDTLSLIYRLETRTPPPEPKSELDDFLDRKSDPLDTVYGDSRVMDVE